MSARRYRVSWAGCLPFGLELLTCCGHPCPQSGVAQEWTVSGIFAYIYMGAILTDRFHNTRQRDYRKADTDVGADVNGRPATSGRGAADLIPTHIDLLKRRP